MNVRARTGQVIVAVGVMLIGASALAQPPAYPPDPEPADPEAAQPAPDPQPAPEPEPMAQPEPEPAPAPEPEPEPAAQNEELAEMMDFWSHFSISGYVQAELHLLNETEATGSDPDEGEDNDEYFQVRRGRVKFKYQYSLAELVLQIDATENGVALRDAEATFVLPISDDFELRLTGGLFKNPWGLELLVSSKDRWFPERTLVVRRFFPGERDVGLRIMGEVGDLLSFSVAVMNGEPISTSPFPGDDPNNAKDIVGRVGVEVGPLAFGVSGIFGTGFAPEVLPDPMMMIAGRDAFDFTRWGVNVDAKLEYDLGVGELSVYGELAIASGLDRRDVPADENADPSGNMGWYLAVTQGLGEHFGLGVRIEQYDRNTDADDDGITRLTAAALLFPVDHARVTLAFSNDFLQGSDETVQEYWLRGQVDF